jgi:single-stranded DNA-binding protein
MSFFALITGVLVNDPQQRIGANGKPYTTATVLADDVFASCIAFGALAEQLAGFSKGSVVSVAGRSKLTSWTGKDGEQRHGLSVTVAQIIGVSEKRKCTDFASPRARKPSNRKARGAGFLAPSSGDIPNDPVDDLWGPVP